MSLNILCTGGAGFVGSHLVERLVRDNHHVTVYDDLSTGQLANLDNVVDDIRLLRLPVEDMGVPSNIRYDAVFHLAAKARIQPSFENPILYHQSNVTGTVRMLEIARAHHCPFIFAGSSSVLSNQYLNPYTFGKKVCEDYCHLYYDVFGVSTAILRFHNVYGPRQIESGPYSTVIGVFEKQWRAGLPLTVTGDGEQRRDFTHVLDIVDGLAAAMDALMVGRDLRDPISLGTGASYSINEVASMFPDTRIEYVPKRPGEAFLTVADPERALTQLKWSAGRKLEDYIKGVTTQLVSVEKESGDV